MPRFSRGRLKDISFEPSRNPSVFDELSYRESFFEPDRESFLRIDKYTFKARIVMKKMTDQGFYGITNKPLP